MKVDDLTTKQKATLSRMVEDIANDLYRLFDRHPADLPSNWSSWQRQVKAEIRSRRPDLYNLIEGDKNFFWHAARYVDERVARLMME